MENRQLISDFWHRFKEAFNDEIPVIFKRFTFHWLMWILPLIIFVIISSIFYRGVLFDLPVGYVDQDKSTLSREIIRDLNAGAHANLINYDNQLKMAERDLEKAKIYAILYIPPNFEADVLAGRQPTPMLYYNALYYSAGLYSIMDYSGLIASLNTQYRTTMATSIGLPVPKLSQVNFNYDGLFNASGNSMYFQQFSAVVHLLQLFVVTTTIHILSRLPKRTRPNYPFVLGKLAPYTIWYTMLLMFEIAMLVLFSDARVSGSPFAMMLVVFFYVIAAQSIGILLYTFTKTVLDAYTYIGVLVGLALTYSGVVVPELSMPWIARFISSLEPLTYALNKLFDLFLRHSSYLSVLKTCGILMIYPIIITVLVRKRLVKRLHSQ
ncbi:MULTISPECIES: ABC transporter permease [unclassified Gilliamella]|uniref:ABC transporter permease n=1 Tax=unclassified Gilliamella TaxID=2685620 RepID=UPI00080EA3DE|nr:MULTISPECIES: ABC transporter permease [Gilliamella]MCX8581929.1 ABC transporter permease [Gilliamella sp. B3482]MCX8583797.1 ABC transporter permease [Gilliamella sp. B3372]MCX8586190.1 ABC transporter permease [Gilliamella sp. B3562]MCX8594994.1 ABC transporter permease [Gilliamella sp. B3367]MCX8597503.1 ABC transporter permease [Gilliamella sp. B3493]